MGRIGPALLCAALSFCGPLWAQEDQPLFKLAVIRGEDAQNNIKKGRATKAVVEVRDRNNKPVAGVAVVFLLPNSGAGGSFVGGTQTASVSTNGLGQAGVTYQPNNVAGSFNLKASVRGPNGDASISIPQSNIAGMAAGGISTTAIVLITVATAAAGIGLGVGLTRDSGASPTSIITLTPGVPVAGSAK